jgi:hypothetical protein
MVKCVRGFVRFQKSYGWERAVKVFTEKTEQQGDKVVRIINAYPIGDNVFCVLANVDILSNEELLIQGFNALGNHVAMNSFADMMKMRDEKRV